MLIWTTGGCMVRLWVVGLMITSAAMATEVSAQSTVTFNKDVLPILQNNCQSCHRPGQVAPMSLLTYKDVRPWAKAIKAATVARKMPPWNADPRYGHYTNDRSLKQSAIDTLTKWVDAGASEGDSNDAPFFFSSRRRHTRSVSAFLLNRSSDLKDGVNATPLPTVNTTGYIDHAAFLGTINPDTNKIPKHLFQGYLNIYNNYFKAPWMPHRTEANPNELNQDDARYGFR